MKFKAPKHCKGCVCLHRGGRDGTIYTIWCMKFSKCSTKAVGQCKLTNGKVSTNQTPELGKGNSDESY